MPVKNILLILAMTNLQCIVDSNDKRAIIKVRSEKDGRVLVKGVLEGGLNRSLVDPVKHGSLLHDYEKMGELWHKRFGHLHYGALSLLKDIV